MFLKLSMLPPWIQVACDGGGGGFGQTSCLYSITKQAVKFPQVLASNN